MDILYENIKRLRKQLGMSQEELAKKTGYSDRSSIAKIETGEVDLSQSKIEAFARALNVTPQFLMGYEVNNKIDINLPNPETVRTIPVYGELSCGNGLFTEDAIIDYITIPVSMLPNKSADYFAQYANGDSMEGAGIYDGDLIIFKKSSAIDSGEIGCFCIDENIATCKKFSQIEGRIFLLPMNDKYSPIPIEPENECFRVVGIKVLLISKSNGGKL